MEPKKKFLGCIDCRETIPFIPANQASEYSVRDGKICEESRDDFADFKSSHLGHSLKIFFLSQDGWLNSTPVSDKPYSEPVKEEYFCVRDEKCTEYLIRRRRDSIEKSFQYEILRGWLKFDLAEIRLQKEEITTFLNKEGLLLGGDERDEFFTILEVSVDFCKHGIETVLKDEDSLQMADLQERHPLVALFRIRGKPEKEIIGLINYTVNLTFPSLTNRLTAFIKNHRDDIMTIQVTRKFQPFILENGKS